MSRQIVMMAGERDSNPHRIVLIVKVGERFANVHGRKNQVSTSV
jgi:hypothetical protein